ncbi:anhydro-N-acetylmuramic acid kinase [Pedobacter sp. P351]|uniref:anhydro-N-acetylmuramic acid kinase n=1 Tax=Pedobacter superstes TaxID=3133441 RepID=UPI0030963E2A
MNESLNRLANLFRKESRMIIGLMSGTSLDGLDIALCKISGSGLNTRAEVLQFETADYSDEFKEDLRTIFSKKQADLEKVTLLNSKIGLIHAELINRFLKKFNIPREHIDCIASHGQTIYHAPKRLHQLKEYPNSTLQIGDADHIALKTGITTLSDFRQKHIAAGGEGAPLALYGDYILFSSNSENRVLLNIGGISNFTYLPETGSNKAIICTDAGPGNTLIDGLCKKHFNISYDKDGGIAQKGTINIGLLNSMLKHPFFYEDLPKTTGPELFNQTFIQQSLMSADIENIRNEDLIATVTQLTVEALALALKKAIGDTDCTLYLSGGGVNNSFLVEKIVAKFPKNAVKKLEELGISADAKEAVLFALLANETICGSALETNAGPRVMMGKISLPE